MNQSFIYQNSERIDNLIAELRTTPNTYIRVPIGKRRVPLLDRMILFCAIFLVSFIVFLVPSSLFLIPFQSTLSSATLGASLVLIDSAFATVAGLVGFFLYKRREEYKRCLVEDLTYYDLARLVAKRYNLEIDEEPETLEPVDENLDEGTPEGVIFWMRRVQGEGEIVPGRLSFDNLENSIKYLTAIERHSSYVPSSTVLSGITETLKKYDSLVNNEIPTPKVVRVLRKIEAVLPDYENACKQMYEDAIENELMETEVHLQLVNTQVGMKGLAEEDFNLEEIDETQLPNLIRKKR